VGTTYKLHEIEKTEGYISRDMPANMSEQYSNMSLCMLRSEYKRHENVTSSEMHKTKKKKKNSMLWMTLRYNLPFRCQ